jgi:hypothetical protein
VFFRHPSAHPHTNRPHQNPRLLRGASGALFSRHAPRPPFGNFRCAALENHTQTSMSAASEPPNSIQLSTLGAVAAAPVATAPDVAAAPHPHVPAASAQLDEAAPKLHPSAAQQAVPSTLHLNAGPGANPVPSTPINPYSDFTPAAERQDPTPTTNPG